MELFGGPFIAVEKNKICEVVAIELEDVIGNGRFPQGCDLEQHCLHVEVSSLSDFSCI